MPDSEETSDPVTVENFRQAADQEAFRPLDAGEDERFWGLVDRQLGFHPSTRPGDWPGFNEPEGSITWSAAPLFDDFEESFVDAEIELASVLAFAADKVRGGDDSLVCLDWQHPGYWFDPAIVRPPSQAYSWPIPVLPDGDYYLFLATDLRFGWLTHPWEQTVCCYGDLLAEMQPALERLGLPILRRSGVVE